MKILMLPAWLPNRLELSRIGVENYAAVTSFFNEQADDLYRHSGIRVDVLMPKIYSVAKLLRLQSFPVFGKETFSREGGETWIGYYPYLLRSSRVRNWKYFGEKLFSDYTNKHGMPDIIWCCGVLWSAFLANHLYHRYKLPYFIVEHTNGQVMNNGTKKSRAIKKEIIRLFQESAFNAAPCAQTARSMELFLGEQVGEIQVITNTISEYFENMEEPLSLNIDDQYIIHSTARMDDNKNHNRLIEAFAQFSHSVPIAKLHLAGDGINLGQIKSQIAHLGLEKKVILLGHLSRDELAKQMRQASAFIAVSTSETFNISLIEALACGLPCISTPTGVAPDAIDEKNGVVINSPNRADILKGMQYVYKRRAVYNRIEIRKKSLENYSGAVLAKQIQFYWDRSIN